MHVGFAAVQKELNACRLCPRACMSSRSAGETGVCGETQTVRLARAALHMWEEPPISGEAGSGTVFFSGCTLKCVYCQNLDISCGEIGQDVSIERLAQIFLEQQARGALNINLVTPTHFAPQICEAIDLAREGRVQAREEIIAALSQPCQEFDRLRVPIVYNTSGYETAEAIASLKGHVDIFLTDYKYASSELAKRYSKAADYPQVVSAALDAMYECVGPYTLGCGINGEEEILQSGIIVRHLVLPGCIQDSRSVLQSIAAKPYADDVCVSLMSQYTPCEAIGKTYPELDTKVDEGDYDELIDYALDLGLVNSFMQEGGAAEESFIPSFDYEGL